MKSASELARGARRLRMVTLIALLLVAAVSLYAVAGALFGFGVGLPIRLTSNGGDAGRTELAVAAISGAAFIAGLWRLMRMLRRVEAGELFTRGTIGDLRGFTSFVLASALISILLPVVIELVSAVAAGGDVVRIALDFAGGDFFALLVSGLLFLIARLLSEAQRIAEDASQIV